MQTWNDRNAYGWVALTLHWLAAIGVLTMLFTGFSAGVAEDHGDRAGHRALMAVHVAVGLSFYLIFAARIASHYMQKAPIEPDQPGALRFIARATHNLLLLMIAVQIISGPLMIWAHARPINAGFVSIPSPFATRSEAVEHIADIMHLIGRWSLVVLISLHVLGALKHLFVDRDGLFERIFVPGARIKTKAPPAEAPG
ncbi:MAG: cytochrome b/b6 domain-containing protein [Proteobacteria bacterium]|nr:cytochrome b/b6 domain-containing protein [Pseudomonadota bacterium]